MKCRVVWSMPEEVHNFALSLKGRNMACEIAIIDNKLAGQGSFYFGLGRSLDSFMQWIYVESTHVNLEISKKVIVFSICTDSVVDYYGLEKGGRRVCWTAK